MSKEKLSETQTCDLYVHDYHFKLLRLWMPVLKQLNTEAFFADITNVACYTCTVHVHVNTTHNYFCSFFSTAICAILSISSIILNISQLTKDSVTVCFSQLKGTYTQNKTEQIIIWMLTWFKDSNGIKHPERHSCRHFQENMKSYETWNMKSYETWNLITVVWFNKRKKPEKWVAGLGLPLDLRTKPPEPPV